jgi:uncharacterized protein YdbL (DUF1318 family)
MILIQGKFEIWSLLKITTMERLIRFHAWESEQAIRKMHEKSRELDCNIETFVIIIDAAGWSLRLATGQAMTFIKGMAITDSGHYPERLGKLIVINAPQTLAIAWRVISTFLDDVQRAKINILADRKDWFPALLETMHISQIPKQYGGEAPDFAAEEAFQSLDPPKPAGTSITENFMHNGDCMNSLEKSMSSLRTNSQTSDYSEADIIPVRNAFKSSSSNLCRNSSTDKPNQNENSPIKSYLESFFAFSTISDSSSKLTVPESKSNSNLTDTASNQLTSVQSISETQRAGTRLKSERNRRQEEIKFYIDTGTQTEESIFKSKTRRTSYLDRQGQSINCSCAVC